MGHLPIPAEQYFKDFSFELETYTINRNSINCGSALGLLGNDEDGKHIAFLLGCDITPGDVLICDSRSYVISSVVYDKYSGQPELLKALY
ncbi:MAG: hypothetical protein ACERKN_07280 [Velocimicrobium sp.]